MEYIKRKNIKYDKNADIYYILVLYNIYYILLLYTIYLIKRVSTIYIKDTFDNVYEWLILLFIHVDLNFDLDSTLPEFKIF